MGLVQGFLGEVLAEGGQVVQGFPGKQQVAGEGVQLTVLLFEFARVVYLDLELAVD